MLWLRHTLAIAALSAAGAPVLWAQTPAAADPPAGVTKAGVNMTCGAVYSPQWDNCVGAVTYPNGNIYRGEFHHGQREGLGMIVIRARGISDERNILSSEPNTIYAGEFRDDRLNGHGIWFTPRGAYAGTFVNNIPQPDVARRDCTGEPAAWTRCVARIALPNGNVYSGEVMHGVMEGLGLLEIHERGVSDASVVRALLPGFYVGQFKHGRLNGKGMISLQGGSGVVGTFTDNVLSAPSRPALLHDEGTGAPLDMKAVLQSLMSDPLLQRRVIGTAASSQVLQYNPCVSAHFALEKTFIPYKPLAMDGIGRIFHGAWKQVVEEEGCGSQRQLNVLVSVAAGQWSMIPLVPGNTRADALLQNDAFRYAVAALGAVRGGLEPNCRVAYVADTQFVAEDQGGPQPGARSRAWREIWTLASCTQQMIVPMHFIPDATGTTITPGPVRDIKVLPLTKGNEVRRTPARAGPAPLVAGLSPAVMSGPMLEARRSGAPEPAGRLVLGAG